MTRDNLISTSVPATGNSSLSGNGQDNGNHLPLVMHVLGSASNGGAERAFIDIVKALHNAGLPQRVVLRPHPQREQALQNMGLPFLTLPFGGLFDLRTSRALHREIMQHRPVIVQTWLSRAACKLPRKDRLSFPSGSRRLLPKSPAQEGGNFPPLYVARLGGYYNLKYYKKIDLFIANTPDIRNYVITNGIDECCVTYIANYATPPKHETGPRHETGPKHETGPDSSCCSNQAKRLREHWKTPSSAPLFLTLSRLHPDKGIDVFLKALAEVPEAYGWIAGTGPLEQELKTLCSELGLDDRVRFMGWQENTAPVLAAADIFILPSRLEPFGNAFLNAWAARVPVIASASQGPVQFISNGHDGLIFPVDSPAHLAQHMRTLLTDPAQGHKLAAAGYNSFLKSFSKEICVKNYLEFYTSARTRWAKSGPSSSPDSLI